MGELDWLEQGHGGGAGLQTMIKGSSHHGVDRVSIRRVLRGDDSTAPRKSRRRTKALAGWLIYCCTAVGGTAAAFAVRDTLFPSLGGAPSAPVLWAAPVETEHGSTTTAAGNTTPAQNAVGAADFAQSTVVSTPASVDDQTASSANPNEGPGSSVDDHGRDGGASPVTGTTVADDSGKAPGPGTTVADNPTESSTASTPPISADITTVSAPPTSPGSGDAQRGKGGGGSGTTQPPTP